MKTSITVLLAVMLAQGGDNIMFPDIGLQARAGMKGTFPPGTEFYCIAITGLADKDEAETALNAFANGGNSEQVVVQFARLAMIVTTKSFTSAKYCKATEQEATQLTSSDGSITRFGDTDREFYAIVGSPVNSDADVTTGMGTLTTELEAAGLTGSADMDNPFVFYFLDASYSYFCAFLSPV